MINIFGYSPTKWDGGTHLKLLKKSSQYHSPFTEILPQEKRPTSCTRGMLNITPPSLPKTPAPTFLFSRQFGCPFPTDAWGMGS